MGTMKSFQEAEARPHSYEEILEGLAASDWDWLESLARTSGDLETLNLLSKALLLALQGLSDEQSDNAGKVVEILEGNPLYSKLDPKLKGPEGLQGEEVG